MATIRAVRRIIFLLCCGLAASTGSAAEKAVSAQRLAGHAMPVEALTFSPDGRLAASGSRDRTIRLWDVQSAKAVGRFEGHSSDVKAVAFSADGKFVVSGSGDRNVARLDPKADNDCSVRLWEVRTGKELRRLDGHSVEVCAVAFSPDGSRIASGGADRTCIIWDAATGREVARVQRRAGRVETVAVSPDGRAVLTGTDEGEVTLWNADSAARSKTYGEKLGKVTCVAFSPDGHYIASGHDDVLVQRSSGPEGTKFRDCSVRIWDVASGAELRKFAWDDFGPKREAFSRGSERVAASLTDEVRVWTVPEGKQVATFQLPEAGTTSAVAFLPDGLYAMNSIGFFNGDAWLYKLRGEQPK
jgi:WD40 repeat protein